MHQRQRRQNPRRVVSARAFAREKDEMESAGALEVGELLSAKAGELNSEKLPILR